MRQCMCHRLSLLAVSLQPTVTTLVPGHCWTETDSVARSAAHTTSLNCVQEISTAAHSMVVVSSQSVLKLAVNSLKQRNNVSNRALH